MKWKMSFIFSTSCIVVYEEVHHVTYSIDARKMGKKRSQIFAARRRKSRDERKQAGREAERLEREVADGAGSPVEMKFESDEMKSENDKRDSCSSDADNGSELVTNCKSSAGTKPDESHLGTLSMLDVSIKCETDLLVNSEDEIGLELRLQAGEKSFACRQCDKKFTRKCRMKGCLPELPKPGLPKALSARIAESQFRRNVMFCRKWNICNIWKRITHVAITMIVYIYFIMNLLAVYHMQKKEIEKNI